MGDRRMADCVAEQLNNLAGHLDMYGDALADWIQDPDWETLDALEHLHSMHDVAFCYGYLRGCADTLDKTTLEMLDLFEIDIPEDA